MRLPAFAHVERDLEIPGAYTGGRPTLHANRGSAHTLCVQDFHGFSGLAYRISRSPSTCANAGKRIPKNGETERKNGVYPEARLLLAPGSTARCGSPEEAAPAPNLLVQHTHGGGPNMQRFRVELERPILFGARFSDGY